MNSNQINELADGTLSGDAVNYGQLLSATSGNSEFQGGYNADTNTPDLDSNPSTSIQLKNFWINEGFIQYLGEISSVQKSLTSCRFYVLPSYREGTPRSVLEAMATGRPVITTDTPGCRETVIDLKI